MSERDEIGFYQDGVGEFRWTQKAPNGRDVDAASEGYHNYADAFSNASRDKVLEPTEDEFVFTVVPLREVRHRAWIEGKEANLEWALSLQTHNDSSAPPPVNPYADPDR